MSMYFYEHPLMLVLLATVAAIGPIVILIPIWLVVRTLMLRWLLRVGALHSQAGSIFCFGIWSELKWNVWFLRDINVYCQLRVEALITGEVLWDLPLRKGEEALLRAGSFKWEIVTKNDGDDYATVAIPSLAEIRETSWDRRSVIVPKGKWYLITIRLGYRGITVARRRYLLSAFGRGVNYNHLKWQRYYSD